MALDVTSLVARVRADHVAALAETGLSPYEMVVAAAFEQRIDTAEVIALRAKVKALKEEVATLREARDEGELPPLRDPEPDESGLKPPLRDLFNAFSEVGERGCLTSREIARICKAERVEQADQFVVRLQRRLDGMGHRIKHISGVGYRLIPRPMDAEGGR